MKKLDLELLEKNGFLNLTSSIDFNVPSSYLPKLTAEQVKTLLSIGIFELEWSFLKKKWVTIPTTMEQSLPMDTVWECVTCKDLEVENKTLNEIIKTNVDFMAQQETQIKYIDNERMELLKQKEANMWSAEDKFEEITKLEKIIKKYEQALEEESKKQSELLRSNNEFRPFKEKYEELIAKFDDEVEKKCGIVLNERDRYHDQLKEVERKINRYASFLDKKWLVLPPA